MVGLNCEGDALIRSKMVKDVLWSACTDCNFKGSANMVYKHIEKNHVTVSFNCTICGKHCVSRNSLLVHRSRFHRKSKMFELQYQ